MSSVQQQKANDKPNYNRYKPQTNPVCKCCGKQMSVKEYRARVKKEKGGRKEYIRVPRYICAQCNKTCTCLPDYLCPRKHYTLDTIQQAVEREENTVEDSALDDGGELLPSDQTIIRWKQWINRLLNNVTAFFNSKTLYRKKFELDHGDRLTIEKIKGKVGNWLSFLKILKYEKDEDFCFS